MVRIHISRNPFFTRPITAPLDQHRSSALSSVIIELLFSGELILLVFRHLEQLIASLMIGFLILGRKLRSTLLLIQILFGICDYKTRRSDIHHLEIPSVWVM